VDKARFSFLDGAIVDPSCIRLVAVEDARAERDVPHGIILTFRGGSWRGVEVGERLVSCTVTPNSAFSFVAIAESGREVDIGGSGLRQEVVAVGEHSPASNGPLTAVRACPDGQVFCVGTARQAYRKLSESTWARVDQTCKSQNAEHRADSAFLAVDGFSGAEVYAVGWDGEIWQFDSVKWHRRDSPTNAALLGVQCASDGFVYACGQSGTILKGRGPNWLVVDQEDSEEDLRSVCVFDGVIYVASDHVVYSWDNGTLSAVRMESPVATAGRLVAAGKQLLSVGLKDVALFDGQNWVRIL